MSKQAVLDAARGEVGVTESPPGSNRVKYWDDYDPRMQGQPWCVAFLYSVFLHAGERMAFFDGGRTASCGTLLRWYREQGLTVPVSEVQPGDIVLLNFHGGKDPEHCGLVVDYSIRVSPKTGAPEFVVTIEGNTTPGLEGGQDSGGSVALKNRDFWNIVAVCRPQYKPEPVLVDDVSGHWAEPSIRRAMERGIMQGYPDGSWKPDQPVTRAELAVILDRLDEGREDDLK